MRAVVQRVSTAKVAVKGETVAEIGPGLLVLVGAHRDDTDQNAKKLADRVAGMRIFNDADGKMNLSFLQAHPLPLREAEGEGAGGGGSHPSRVPAVLAVSNFTVYGDPSQRRPSFIAAAPYEQGERLFDAFVAQLRSLGVPVQTGTFGAHMEVELTNDGPVTLVVDC